MQRYGPVKFLESQCQKHPATYAKPQSEPTISKTDAAETDT